MSSGFLLVNKPAGPTSHDVVDYVRRATGVKTVGHAGTLDPFATGLLIVGVGREATREFPKLVGLDKRYRAVLHLGATSDTDDRTGKISPHPTLSLPGEGRAPSLPVGEGDREGLELVLKKFTGKIQQIPPMYSAKKIGGKKLYELARKGETVERAPVELEIYELTIINYQKSTLTLDIHCSSGTYIRALARDIGESLGTGAYLEELERTAIGPFTIKESVPMTGLTADTWERHLRGVSDILSTVISPS